MGEAAARINGLLLNRYDAGHEDPCGPGLITEAAQAEEIIATGQADAVFLARAMLDDPHWALHAAKLLGVDVAVARAVRAREGVKPSGRAHDPLSPRGRVTPGARARARRSAAA